MCRLLHSTSSHKPIQRLVRQLNSAISRVCGIPLCRKRLITVNVHNNVSKNYYMLASRPTIWLLMNVNSDHMIDWLTWVHHFETESWVQVDVPKEHLFAVRNRLLIFVQLATLLDISHSLKKAGTTLLRIYRYMCVTYEVPVKLVEKHMYLYRSTVFIIIEHFASSYTWFATSGNLSQSAFWAEILSVGFNENPHTILWVVDLR